MLATMIRSCVEICRSMCSAIVAIYFGLGDQSRFGCGFLAPVGEGSLQVSRFWQHVVSGGGLTLGRVGFFRR